MPDRAARVRRIVFRVSSAALLTGILLAALCPWGNASELRRTPIVRAVQQARPSVVNIRGEKTVSTQGAAAAKGDAGRRVNGMGTGVVIDPRGYVLTNFHVVDGVREIQITTADQQNYVARLIARDMETDLAVIKIDPQESLPVITLGTSSDLMPGEPVIAVGNAYGYEHTVTRGIVSALHRAVQVSDAQFYDDLIQTDASINPGNSGGPLLNIDGEMIGINVAVRAGAQGIGFAIPSDKALGVAATLMARATTKKTWHGVALLNDSKPSDKGVPVVAIEAKSPAAEAGLEVGDVISQIGNIKIQRPVDFQRAMLERQVGDEVEVVFERGEEKQTVQLKLAGALSPAREPGHPAWTVLGLQLSTITPETFQQRYGARYRGGLTVTAVRPDSPASEQGIQPGDVLVGMHVWETISLENVTYIMRRPDFSSLSPVKFFILRGSETLYGYLPVIAKTVRR